MSDSQVKTAPLVLPPVEKKEIIISDKMPKPIWYIIGNEGAERFSFYGMKSILVVFMVQYLQMIDNDAIAANHYFVTACYLFPLLGAFIADRIWGKYKTILYLSLFYCFGHATIAMNDTKIGLYIGLALIAFGSGGIKPCVSAYVGDQFNETNKHLVKKVFNWFYWMINFGSFFSTLWIPVLLKKYGPSVAFAVPGILMGIAVIIFWLGRKDYVNVPPSKENKEGFSQILWYSLMHWSQKKRGEHLFDVAKAKYSEASIEGSKAVLRIMKVFIAVSVFWALFDQSSSSWVLQAEQMDLNVLGMKFESSQIGALNPLMVMGLIPLCSFWLYPMVEKIFRTTFTPLKKMASGMFIAAFSFVIIAVFQYLLDSGMKLSVAWQFIPYLIITVAEVFISITGLEFAYTQAPKTMKSTIMSFWLLTVALGNQITAIIAEINIFSGTMFFVFFAVLMLIMAFVFAYLVRGYKVVDYMNA